MRTKLYFLILLLLSCLGLYSIERAVIRISHPAPELVTSYQTQGYDLAAYFPGQWLDLVVPVSEIPRLRNLHPGLIITQTEAEQKANLRSGDRTLPGYRSYAALMTELITLTAQHSEIMTLTTLGTGWGSQYNALGYSAYADFDHNLVAVKISDNPTLDEDEPAVFFFGAHHAREPLSVETTMAVLHDLVDNYTTDPWVTEMVNNAAIWFVPMVNPDGHKIVWDQDDTWWRKNLRDNNGNHQFDSGGYYGYGLDGVDLNRNYGFGWGYMSASDDPEYVTYHGLNEFSEPETQIIRDLLMAHPFVAGISYHTYSELVLYPYGYLGDIYAPDVEEISALAVEMANLIPSESGGHYTPQPSWALYAASGGLDDWAYGEEGIFSYTIELSTTFIPNANTVNLVTQRIKPAARKLMERITKSMLTGHVIDAVSSQPVEASIFVQGIDNSPLYNNQYKSTLPFGSYYRLLPAGNWQVRISAPGYLPWTGMVVISETEVTTQDVVLTPVATGNLTITVQTFGEIPVGGVKVEFTDTALPAVYTDIIGAVTLTDFPYGYHNLRLSKAGYEAINLSQTIQGPGLFFLLSDSPSVAQNFETNLAAWTTTGSWNVSAADAIEGTKSMTDSPNIDYQDYTTSIARLTAPLNLTNVVNASLSFYVKCDIVLDGDYCALEYSLNNSNWNVLDYFNGAMDWTLMSYDLNSLLGEQVYIRFRMISNDTGNAAGIYIDDFRYYGSGMVVEQQESTISPLATALTNSPNPFSRNTGISFRINTDKARQTELAIYNLKGQRVTTLISDALAKGTHSSVWNGLDVNNNSVASGVYFARLSVEGKPALSRKLLLLK